MRTIRYGLAALLLLTGSFRAQTPEKADPRPAAIKALAAELEAENARYKDAQAALMKSDAYVKARADKDTEKLTALRKEIKPVDRDGFADRAIKAAEELKGDDRARALIWSLEVFPASEKLNKALDALLGEFAKAPVMIEFCESPAFATISRADATKADARLATVVDAAATPTIKAWGLYSQANRLSGPKDATDEAKAKAASLSAEAEKLAAGTPLGDRIAAPRFEKEKLQIGMAAPDIAAADVDGVAFKLSDYAGKVVVLDFWGDW